MNNLQSPTHHDDVTRIYAEEMLASFYEQMCEAERLADELNNLLSDFQASFEREGIGEHIEMLTCWTERYRHGLLTADKILRNGYTWLANPIYCLNKGGEKPDRLEDESHHIFHNQPTNFHPTNLQIEDFVAAAQQVGALSTRMEHLFGRSATGMSSVRP